MSAERVDLGDDAEPIWKCSECGTNLNTEEQAEKCCGDDEVSVEEASSGTETEADVAQRSGQIVYPDALQSRGWWVNWVLAVRYDEMDGGNAKDDATPTKQPVAPYQNGDAEPALWNFGLDDDEHPHTDHGTVLNWEGAVVGVDVQAPDRVLSDELGVGIIIPPEQEGRTVTLLDWDDVRDPETGEVHPVCRAALEECDGFAEISQSGEGVHQFVYGEIPGGFSKFLRHVDDVPFVGNSLPMLEMYSSGRLTAMTGHHVEGSGTDLVDGQDMIDRLCREFGTATNNSPGTVTDPFGRDGDISHEEVGNELRESVEYCGEDPSEWDTPDGESVAYHAVLRARERSDELPNTANWELIGYAASIGKRDGLSKEQILSDLESHPTPQYGYDRSRAEKEVRSVFRKVENGNQSPPSQQTLIERGILPESVATGPDHPVYDVTTGLELHLYPVTGKESRLVVYQNGVQEYSERVDTPVFNSGAAFWESPRKRSLVAGRIVDALTGVRKDELKKQLKETFVDIANDSQDSEWCELLRTKEYEMLNDRTKKVICHPTTDGALWSVEMEPHPDRPEVGEKALEFDEGGLNDSNPANLETKHLGAFLAKIDVDSATWEQLQEEWIGSAEAKKLDEGDDAVEQAVEEFLYEIAESYTLLPEDSKGSFSWDRKNGLYAEGDYSEAVVYIPGTRVAEYKDKHLDDDDVNLSVELRERGVMVDTTKRKSINGTRKRVWPIAFSQIDRDEDELDGMETDAEEAPEEVDL